MKRPSLRRTAAALAVALGGCAIGPDYQRPTLNDLPAQWQAPAGWQAAAPADAQPKAAWWSVFGDPQLDALEAQCIDNNAQLKVALARFDQAAAQARMHGAAALPTLVATANGGRGKISGERPLSNYASPNSSTVQNDFKPLLTVGYELDWLGRVRRDVESARATAEQSRALVRWSTSASSAVHERRPDIASAERAMAAANAQIGVARAAYFPQLTLGAGIGYESTAIAQLLSAPALLWSIGLQAGQTVFDGGRIGAGVDFAQAGYQAAVANYRQTVLHAIQEAQTALDATRELASAHAHQATAVGSQRRAYEISLVRYREGLDNALTLAVNQQNMLAAQRVDSQLRGNQFVAAVSLQKALGGGWASDR